MSSSKNLLKSFLKWTVGILGVFGLVTIVGIAWLGYSFNQALETKVDPALYEDIVTTRISSSSDYSFLPKAIDPEAEAVGFYYVPGFLQGGDVLCLRLKLPTEKIAKLVDDLEASDRTEVDSFGDIPEPECYPEFGIPQSQKDSLSEKNRPLLLGFRIFLFKSDLEDIEKNPNHNFLAFTAVSFDKREVVYYADSW